MRHLNGIILTLLCGACSAETVRVYVPEIQHTEAELTVIDDALAVWGFSAEYTRTPYGALQIEFSDGPITHPDFDFLLAGVAKECPPCGKHTIASMRDHWVLAHEIGHSLCVRAAPDEMCGDNVMCEWVKSQEYTVTDEQLSRAQRAAWALEECRP